MPLRVITNEYAELTKPNKRGVISELTALSFEEFKSALGQAKSKYTDEQIEYMRVVFDKLADRVFDDWLYSKNSA